jgi:hypothetical protein
MTTTQYNSASSHAVRLRTDSSRAVLRACGATRWGSRSVKIRRVQVG